MILSEGGSSMGEKVEVVVKEAEEEAAGRNPFLEATRKMLLAGAGAVALAQEEMEAFVDKLVERGQLAEQDGKNLVRDVMDRRKRDAQKAEQEFETRIEQLLHRMNVPSKRDVDDLSAKIAALSKKVDELKGS
jgi:poly(hydroxyalkanoate) granule-associated protein